MILSSVPVWRKSPCLRLVLPLIAGIIIQGEFTPSPLLAWGVLLPSISVSILLNYLPVSTQFSWFRLQGIFIHAAIAATGCLLTKSNDSSRAAKQVLPFAGNASAVVVAVEEPLSEKPASWKAQGSIQLISRNGSTISPGSGIFLYFLKDSLPVMPAYGDLVVFTKPLRSIENSSTSSFDYQAYCARKNFHFQVFLKKEEFVIIRGLAKNRLYNTLLAIRIWVVSTLKRYIPGKKECGLAQALLIGYKDEVDKTLMQAYSNTGVVHVIAISGLHLGIIYEILKRMCFPFGKKRAGRWASLCVILGGLWIFAFLSGGSPSVLRSALMFSFIVFGQVIAKRTSIINSLSASAFMLLSYDPFWLWDLGFQLSYGALFSIVIFMKPIYSCMSFKYSPADAFWKLNAVTLSAQVLTTPMAIYYFHQFPNLFLITNVIAVPLSGLILIGTILLCGLSFVPWLATHAGWLLLQLIRLMNGTVEWLDSFPFSTWGGLQLTLFQLTMLYMAIAALAGWLILHQRKCLPLALAATIGYLFLKVYKMWQ